MNAIKENNKIKSRYVYIGGTQTSTQLPVSDSTNQVASLSDDPFIWPENLSQWQRDQLILKGPVSEFMESNDLYPQDSNKRHFSNEFQYRRLENGEKIRRRWLIYSKTADSAYCF